MTMRLRKGLDGLIQCLMFAIITGLMSAYFFPALLNIHYILSSNTFIDLSLGIAYLVVAIIFLSSTIAFIILGIILLLKNERIE